MNLYEKNLNFFKKHLPEYYNLIQSISDSIEIKNDNLYLNGKKLYPNSITSDSQMLSYNPIINPNWKKDFFFLEPDLWDKEYYITGKIINKIVSKAKKLPSYNKNGFYFDKDFLPSTVIYGLLAGQHLNNLVKKYDFQSLFVYEPIPEFFKISLHYVDYSYIYEKLNERFFLWVKGKINYSSIENFYYERTITSTFFSLELSTYEHPLILDAKNKFSQIRSEKIRGWGTYEDEIKGIKNHFQNIENYPLISSIKKMKIPFCVVANGKSLEKNIDFIKKNKNSMIIVSVGTAIKPLINAGIQSDFHIEQERIETLIDALKDVLPSFEGFFVGANVVNPNVFKMAKKPLMFIREAFTFSNFYPFLIGSSPIVGNAGFAFSNYFTDEIYLCGMDLGFRLNEKKHASNSFYDSLNDIENHGIKIEGNFSDDIYTNSLFLSSKKNIEKLIKAFSLKVYNLSDGAKIEGAIPLKDKVLPKIDKQKYISEILNNFKTTKRKEKNLNISPILNAFYKSLDFKNIKSKKELTGRIDFIEDSIKNMMKQNPAIGALMRGSFYHILNYFYIVAHKIDLKEIQKITDIKNDLMLFKNDFNSITNQYF
jgi:hypothetical protein